MKFDKSRVYTALNAEELKPGDKVIVANSLAYLRDQVEEDDCVFEIRAILTSDNEHRFRIENGSIYALAYLVERKKNCTNCSHSCKSINLCLRYEPKTEQKAEPHHRPFKDTNELIKTWDKKYKETYGLERIDKGLDEPHIWVRSKRFKNDKLLITGFVNDGVRTDAGIIMWYELFDRYEFLDSSLCGVEE